VLYYNEKMQVFSWDFPLIHDEPTTRLVTLRRALDGSLGLELHKVEYQELGEPSACVIGLLQVASPALLSKQISSGDILQFVDGQGVHSKTENEVHEMLQGTPYTNVTLCLSCEDRQMVSVRRNQHGWIGLCVTKIPHGPCVVDHILPNSPLAKLGSGVVQRGDMIHAIGTVKTEKVYNLESDDVVKVFLL
jgi:C-terminal processing protease CtpA/Prc